MKKYLLAHDLGTSGNKATLFDTDGQLIKSVVTSYDTKVFNGNWCEQNPMDWWKAVCTSTKTLLEDVDPENVLALSFSGQMMGCLPVDKEGMPLCDALIWADQRSQDQADQLMAKIPQQDFYRITGHRISPSYSIEKLMWVRDHLPELYAKTYKCLQAKDFIVHRLTGQFYTDYSDASSTNAFDLNTFTWSKKILEAANIPEDKFPEVQPSTFVVGNVTAQAATLTGLSTKTKVVLGAGDGVCSAVGAGSVEEGQCYSYLGSSAWIAITSKDPLYDDKMRTFNWAHAVPGFVTPCGTMQAAGNSYSWAKNQLCQYEIKRAKEEGTSPYVLMNDLANQSPLGAKGLFFLPYLLGERSPRWNPLARGTFIGLSLEHTKPDMIRAVVEGIFYNMAIISDILKSHMSFDEMNIIGGLAQGELQRQMMADLYDVEINKLKHLEEATSMGAAVIAGVGVGCFDNFNVIKDFLEIDDRLSPIPENVDAYQHRKPLFEACYEQLVPLFEKLSSELS